MHFNQVAVWGVGLLGGSLGMALRQRQLATTVIGVGRNIDRLKQALDLGACDEITTDPREGFAQADLIVVCMPVAALAESFTILADCVQPGVIVTDVGSTKQRIVEAAESHLAGRCLFVGSHPMSGAEVSGVQHARADLYKGNPCFLTPTPSTDLQALSTLAQLWQTLGSRVVITDPARHDELVAAVSHVPHLSSVALTLLAAGLGEDLNLIPAIVGNGFWDTTRLAKGDLAMWSEICQENDASILKQLDRLIEILSQLRERVRTHEMRDSLSHAAEFRRELDQLRTLHRAVKDAE